MCVFFFFFFFFFCKVDLFDRRVVVAVFVDDLSRLKRQKVGETKKNKKGAKNFWVSPRFS